MASGELSLICHGFVKVSSERARVVERVFREDFRKRRDGRTDAKKKTKSEVSVRLDVYGHVKTKNPDGCQGFEIWQQMLLIDGAAFDLRQNEIPRSIRHGMRIRDKRVNTMASNRRGMGPNSNRGTYSTGDN
jgi:hypothetical protein